VTLAVLTSGGALFAMGHGQVEIAAPALAVVATAAVGSLVPDIDHPKAWISNRIPATMFAYGFVFVLAFGFGNWYASRLGSTAFGASLWVSLVSSARPYVGWAVLAMVLGISLLVLARVVAATVEHRGPTHSLGASAALALGVCIGCAVAGQPWTLGMWFGWGYLSHLLADLITPMGCPALLWPLRSGDLSVPRDSGFSLMPRSASGRFRASPQSTSELAGSTPLIQTERKSVTSDLPPAGPAAPVASATYLTQRALAMVLALGLMSGVALGFLWYLQKGIQSLAPQGTRAAVGTTAVTAAADVPTAQSALRDAAPNIYAALVDPDNPVVTGAGGNFAYEWEYLEKAGAESVKVKTISITLNAEGNIIGTKMP